MTIVGDEYRFAPTSNGAVVHEVYAYGVIAPSTLVETAGQYPDEGGYAEIVAVHPSIGGEAAAGAHVLARLGVPVKLAGNRLPPQGAAALAILETAGVDCSAVAIDDQATVVEVIVATGLARTIFGTYEDLLRRRAWNPPSRQDIANARIVMLDPFFGEESAQAAQWCVDAGVPYVTVDLVPDLPIAEHAEAIVVSDEFARRALPGATPEAIMAAYTKRCTGLIVFTQGGADILFARRGSPPTRLAPFAVDIVDTTGAGDAFRAGIAHGLLHGYDDTRSIRTASAIAAIVCQQAPGVVGSPTATDLEIFLTEAGAES
jgi:sugar/nucleoside kinase (ribokinase family)